MPNEKKILLLHGNLWKLDFLYRHIKCVSIKIRMEFSRFWHWENLSGINFFSAIKKR